MSVLVLVLVCGGVDIFYDRASSIVDPLMTICVLQYNDLPTGSMAPISVSNEEAASVVVALVKGLTAGTKANATDGIKNAEERTDSFMVE